MKRLLLLLTFFCVFGATVSAQEQQEDTLYSNLEGDISLSGLTNFDITVASKNTENLQEAPGVISAYTSKELELLGYYTLRDLADITPGYSSYRGIGEITLETRGQKTPGFDNNQHLLLIDGIPFYHARAGKVNTEEDLPLFFAKQVELLRGPGSALYGTGAYYGVVNLTSKDLDSNRQSFAESKVSAGGFPKQGRLMANTIIPYKHGSFTMNIGLSSKEPSLDQIQDSVPSSIYRDDVTSLFFRSAVKVDRGFLRGFSTGLIYSKKTGGIGEGWYSFPTPTHELTTLTWSTLVPYIKYERPLTNRLSLNTHVFTNYSIEQATTTLGETLPYDSTQNKTFTAYRAIVSDYEASSELHYNSVEGHKNPWNIIVGASIRSRSRAGDPDSYSYTLKPNDSVFIKNDSLSTFYQSSAIYQTYSVYTQAQKRFDNVFKGLTFTLGARYDGISIIEKDSINPSGYSDLISPRIAVVQKFTNNFSAKALYGTALRAPLLKVLELNQEAREKYDTIPNIEQLVSYDLKPTTIHNAELSLIYQRPRFSAVITGFYNASTNAIVKERVHDVIGEVYTNDPSMISATGMELEMTWLPTNHIQLKGNWSYSNPRREDNSYVVDVPIHKVNGIAYFTFKKVPLTIGLVHHWISDFRQTPESEADPEKTYEDHEGFNITDINLRYLITPRLGFEFLTRNVFNTPYTYPASGGINLHGVKGPKRSFMASLNFAF